MAQISVEQAHGQRFLVSLPVRAEWEEKKTGRHIVVEGTTENVGPTGALVTLAQLPEVGSHIRISIEGALGSQVETDAEVVRLIRDLRQPQASLSVLKSQDEWRGSVWELARTRVAQSAAHDDDGEDSYVN